MTEQRYSERVQRLLDRMRLPLIAAPMLRVTVPELVVAACRAGVMGAFPTANARTPERLAEWIDQIRAGLDDETVTEEGQQPAPFCPNLIIRQPALDDHLNVLVDKKVEAVITSVGSPGVVVDPLHSAGAAVFADVATLRHAHRAVDEGVDGLVLLSAGAGGHTGSMNPFAFVRAVREFYDGPVVLSGGISDGVSLAAARALGCDLAYMGTRFIATAESGAGEEYKEMLVNSSCDDVVLTRAFTGLPTSTLRPAIVGAGIDPDDLDENITASDAKQLYGADSEGIGPRRWTELFSAGHSVAGVHDLPSVADLVSRVDAEYRQAGPRP